MAKCNLGKVKHESMWASGLHHYSYVGWFLGFSRALVILQHYCRSQSFCSPCSFGSSLICFLPPPLPPLWWLFWVSVCAFFHRGSQCDGAWWVPLTGLAWLPSRLACSPLLFHQTPSPHLSIVDGFNWKIDNLLVLNSVCLVKIYFYYIDTDEIPGFFLLLKNHIFIVHSEDTIFIFHM